MSALPTSSTEATPNQTDQLNRINYLRSLPSIRTRCSKVFDRVASSQSKYWTLDLSQEQVIVDYICGIITRDYGTDYNSIPPHGRWRHFVGNRIDPMLASWRSSKVDEVEIARRLIDLMMVSVLLDAGAGNVWKYLPREGGEGIGRSEGLAVASLEMYQSGVFSSVEGEPFRVDAEGLSKITLEQMTKSLQVSSTNPMDGLEGRTQLLRRLSSVLLLSSNSQYFTTPQSPLDARPGRLIDYLSSHPTSTQIPSPSSFRLGIDIKTLWDVIINGLSEVWPDTDGRTKIDGIALGDVWSVGFEVGEAEAEEGGELVPFHKLSQWLTYSLIEVMEVVLKWKFIGKEIMTGLPEYRNGGLLLDFKLLLPRFPTFCSEFNIPLRETEAPPQALLEFPPLHASHPSIVEFRAVTVIMLDRLADGIRKKTGQQGLSLPQVLEAGTWKAGREIAKQLRPETAGPPFNLVSDGTVF